MEKKKLKVAFLSFYSGEVYRGVETYVYEFASRLFDLGINVIVYQNGPRLKNTKYKTVSTNFRVDWRQKGRSFRHFRIPLFDYYSRLIGRFTGQSLELIDKDTDVIITTNGSLQIFLTKFWSLTHKAKIVVAGQSGPGMDDRWNLWCFPSVFVGMTDFQCKWAKKTNSLVKVVNIPNGV